MNHHQWNRLITEIQVKLILAALALMGLAVTLGVAVAILRWAGVPC